MPSGVAGCSGSDRRSTPEKCICRVPSYPRLRANPRPSGCTNVAYADRTHLGQVLVQPVGERGADALLAMVGMHVDGQLALARFTGPDIQAGRSPGDHVASGFRDQREEPLPRQLHGDHVPGGRRRHHLVRVDGPPDRRHRVGVILHRRPNHHPCRHAGTLTTTGATHHSIRTATGARARAILRCTGLALQLPGAVGLTAPTAGSAIVLGHDGVTGGGASAALDRPLGRQE